MKRNDWKAIVATCILLFVVCLSASAKGKKEVERGMTQQEVVAILGESKLKSFDTYGDTWEYHKSAGLSTTKIITVVFDREGKVIGYYNHLIEDDLPNGCDSASPHRPAPSFGNGQRPIPGLRPAPGRPAFCLSDDAFSILYNKVKNTNFDSNKLDLIEVASLCGNFSCQQVAQLLKIFSFSSAKMNALEFMGPCIVDPQNAKDIYDVFSFNSEKEKVAEIIRNRK